MRAHRPTGTRLEPSQLRIFGEQIAALNAALTASELRHANTQQKLAIAMALLGQIDEQRESEKEE